jgi:hypothetical protein
VRGTISQSTSDFATLLENTMHKVLQAAYAITPDTWSLFCVNRGTVSDFRAHNRYRMGSFGALDSLNENGEFKNKAILDGEKATITAATKGNIINVSRQMIVNDDMNAFSRLPQLLGRAAALSVEVDAYALLAQNAGLGPTQSDGSRCSTPTARQRRHWRGALGGGARRGRVAMAAQKDRTGGLHRRCEPAVLLVPARSRRPGAVINESQYDPDTLANKSQMKPNVVARLLPRHRRHAARHRHAPVSLRGPDALRPSSRSRSSRARWRPSSRRRTAGASTARDEGPLRLRRRRGRLPRRGHQRRRVRNPDGWRPGLGVPPVPLRPTKIEATAGLQRAAEGGDAWQRISCSLGRRSRSPRPLVA